MTQIFYFSGSGNSRHIAQSLADELCGEAVNLVGFSGEVNADRVGFVTGCYCNDIPRKARELIEALEITRADYLFSVTTSQAGDGFSAVSIDEILKGKGYSLNYAAHVGMLSTFVVTVAPIVAKAENHYRSREADTVKKIASDIKREITRPVRCPAYSLKRCVGKISYFGLVRLMRISEKAVTDSCIGCGKCADICPCGNITVKNGKAVFGSICTYCYGCAHICPTGAVKYGFNNIKGKKQYKRFR